MPIDPETGLTYVRLWPMIPRSKVLLSWKDGADTYGCRRTLVSEKRKVRLLLHVRIGSDASHAEIQESSDSPHIFNNLQLCPTLSQQAYRWYLSSNVVQHLLLNVAHSGLNLLVIKSRRTDASGKAGTTSPDTPTYRQRQCGSPQGACRKD